MVPGAGIKPARPFRDLGFSAVHRQIANAIQTEPSCDAFTLRSGEIRIRNGCSLG
jgi:hypothetical protein